MGFGLQMRGTITHEISYSRPDRWGYNHRCAVPALRPAAVPAPQGQDRYVSHFRIKNNAPEGALWLLHTDSICPDSSKEEECNNCKDAQQDG